MNNKFFQKATLVTVLIVLLSFVKFAFADEGQNEKIAVARLDSLSEGISYLPSLSNSFIQPRDNCFVYLYPIEDLEIIADNSKLMDESFTETPIRIFSDLSSDRYFLSFVGGEETKRLQVTDRHTFIYEEVTPTEKTTSYRAS